eukprot:tig00021293_g20020.t1
MSFPITEDEDRKQDAARGLTRHCLLAQYSARTGQNPARAKLDLMCIISDLPNNAGYVPYNHPAPDTDADLPAPGNPPASSRPSLPLPLPQSH